MESGNNLLLCPAPVALPLFPFQIQETLEEKYRNLQLTSTIACGLLKRDDIKNSLPHLHHNSMDIYTKHVSRLYLQH